MAPEDNPADDDPHAECRHQIERLEQEVRRFKEFGVVMARACDNWREWPGEASGDSHTHPDWKAAARAIIERDELKLNQKIAAAEADKFKAALEAVLIPTNFISLNAARDYISEILGVGIYADEQPQPDTCAECGELAVGFDEGTPLCAAHYRSRPSTV